MSAIAIPLPEDIAAARDAAVAFAEHEVIPRHRDNHAFFADPRALYRADGRFSDELIALIGEVRTASAAAGFYHMCVPEALGERRQHSLAHDFVQSSAPRFHT